MKIAIMHDYFDEIGGAEIVLLYLARGLNAVIFTTNIDYDKINEMGFNDVKIKSIGKVPTIKHLKQIFTQLRFSFLKLKNFDMHIMGGSYSIYAARKNSPNAWYCFSPLRGLYDLRYFKKGFFSPLKQLIKEIQIHFDQKSVKFINKIISSSANVKKRVFNCYKKESSIIHPPTDINEFKAHNSKDYWLSVVRIDPYKRIELQIDTFSRLDDKLIIAGGASREYEKYFNNLKKKAPVNVSFIGPVFDKSKLIILYANCKGFITTSHNEDFGMTPVEAMASGKPVIAPNNGGYKETVVDGVTGRLIDDIDVEKLIGAVKEIGKNPEKYKDACLKQAKKFDISEFIRKVRGEIE